MDFPVGGRLGPVGLEHDQAVVDPRLIRNGLPQAGDQVDAQTSGQGAQLPRERAVGRLGDAGQGLPAAGQGHDHLGEHDQASPQAQCRLGGRFDAIQIDRRIHVALELDQGDPEDGHQ